MSNEQWKEQGDCSICRRQKYCSKPCTIKKRIGRKIAEQMSEMRDDIMKLAEEMK